MFFKWNIDKKQIACNITSSRCCQDGKKRLGAAELIGSIQSAQTGGFCSILV